MKQNVGILFHVAKTMSAYDADGRRKYLSKAEGWRFVRTSALEPPDEARLCLTLYYTGCRLSEALGLKPDDIDLEEKMLLIRTLKKRKKKVVRRVPIPAFLAKSLSGMLVSPTDGRLWAYSRTTAWRIVKRVMLAADISGIHATPKGLRHGFGVRSVLANLPINLIKNGWAMPMLPRQPSTSP